MKYQQRAGRQQVSGMGGVVLALALGLPAIAQALPDAGQSLREIERAPLTPPQRQSLDIALPDEGPVPVAGGPRLTVSAFRFSGNTVISNEELAAVLANFTGRELALGQLQQGVRAITRLYRQHGYPLARAWLPQQEIDDGVVRVHVLEGRYGEIRIDNTAGVKAIALAPLSRLQAGEVVQAASLERALLQSRELAGVHTRATLQPGVSVGSTDLVVAVEPARRFTGSLGADNHGNHYTGEYRLGASLEAGNLLGLGDRLSLSLLGSDEAQLYGRLGWQAALGPVGTQLGVAYSQMDYELGKGFAALDATGSARVGSFWVAQPLHRRRDYTLSVSLQFDHKQLEDDLGSLNHNPKHSRAWTASLSGSGNDDLWGGGLARFTLALSQGRLDLRDTANRAADAATARSQGGFWKISPTWARWQPVVGDFSLYGQLEGQYAGSNLDSSEKMSLGGAYGVRAYPQGEASGDSGWLAKLEARYALDSHWQVVAFADHGEVRLSVAPWTAGNNHRRLSGAGVGANWTQAAWSVRSSLAWTLGNETATSSPGHSPQLWVQLGWSF